MALSGVFQDTKKDGTPYFRSSITYKQKHISLGSYTTEILAHKAYQEASFLLHSELSFTEAKSFHNILPFEKFVSLMNFKDHGIYIKNPIYLMKQYFYYYLDENTPLRFDIEDLFYYSNHKIQKRGNYLFVADYGMQINILSRYGIKNYARPGKDYIHVNKDPLDFSYENIEIVNGYYGVCLEEKNGKKSYRTRIHLNGNYIVGTYPTETEAAIAYNKAVDLVQKKGCKKSFKTNYILSLNGREYAQRYHQTRISKKILNWEPDL